MDAIAVGDHDDGGIRQSEPEVNVSGGDFPRLCHIRGREGHKGIRPALDLGQQRVLRMGAYVLAQQGVEFREHEGGDRGNGGLASESAAAAAA